jgi:hypothetical protein
MKAIYERELDSQFNGLTGYLYGAFMLLAAGFLVLIVNLSSGYTQFEITIYYLGYVYLLAIPILTMRSIAEERHQKTDQLLYSLPMNMTKIVMGKYLALLTVMAVPILVICLYPLVLTSLAENGAIVYGPAYGAIVGLFFLGAALTAIGLFISSLTENMGVSMGLSVAVFALLYFMGNVAELISSDKGASLAAFAVLGLLIGLILWLMTKNITFAGIATAVLEIALVVCYILWKDSFSGLFAKVIEQLALLNRFSNFQKEIFDINSIVYYVTVAGVSLFLTVQAMEKRRWS